MRAYLHLFFGLLIPLSALFIVISIFYFKTDYDFTKSLRLGVLTGVMLSLAVSFVTSIFLQIKRLIENRTLSPKKAKIKAKIRSDKNKIKKTKKSTTATEDEEETDSISQNKTAKSMSQKIMLLMDQELAYEVALNAITYHTLGKIRTSETTKGMIDVKSKKEALRIIITSLTKHTSQVEIESDKNTKSTEKIISYLKEKEHSFLQY
jgi:mannitol-specific phosphotransferase system IIBC component